MRIPVHDLLIRGSEVTTRTVSEHATSSHGHGLRIVRPDVMCPHCPYSFVRLSRFRWHEWLWAVWLRRPYRCECCHARFWGPLK